MPKLNSCRVPSYRKHKATGQAVVTLSGKDHYLGHHGTAASRAEYDRLVAEWVSRGRQLGGQEEGLTVNELILAYWRFAKGYYKRGSGTGELPCIRDAVRWVKALYGSKPVGDFGPLALKSVRQEMINKGWCRSHINHQMNRIRRMFRWGVSEELVSGEVFHSLQAVPGLRRGMTDIREAEPIRPVPEDHVYSALPFMPPSVQTMVQLELLTGCRPHEICAMRTCDLDVSGKAWAYRPASHKTQHYSKERVIFIGPKGQELLRPWLRTELEAHIFAPYESEEARAKHRRECRQSPMTPSQTKRRRKRNRSRAWGRCYTSQSYSRAIRRACEKAGIPAWSPNRLRHLRATQIRREYGLELAKVVLGHSMIETSQIYAERDQAAAAALMEKVG